MCEHTLGGFPDGLVCTDVSGRPHGHVFVGETVDDRHTSSEGVDE